MPAPFLEKGWAADVLFPVNHCEVPWVRYLDRSGKNLMTVERESPVVPLAQGSVSAQIQLDHGPLQGRGKYFDGSEEEDPVFHAGYRLLDLY